MNVWHRTFVIRQFLGSSVFVKSSGGFPSSALPNISNSEFLLQRKHEITVQATRKMAGHNKWSNIRHTKAAKDAQKQIESSRAVRNIKIAALQGGDVNPKYNTLLAKAIKDAQNNDVPKNTINNALARLQKDKESGTESLVEGRGIANSALIVKIHTDKTKHSRSLVQSVLKKFGGSIAGHGSFQHMFDLKGVIKLGDKDGQPMTEDEATEAAIEAGAEEVTQDTDEHGNPVLDMLCDPKEVHMVVKALEGSNISVKSASQEYIPHTFIKLNSDGLEQAGKMLDKLEELEFVVQVFHNIKEED